MSAPPMRSAVATLADTPMKGHSPRKYASVKLFTTMADMKIQTRFSIMRSSCAARSDERRCYPIARVAGRTRRSRAG